MLLSATFRNILSFEGDTTIDFTTGKSKVLSEQICWDGKRDDFHILKTILIFGPNGAGKSNICWCLKCLQNIILGMFHTNFLRSFKLGKEKVSTSFIQVVIKSKGGYYEYSIEFNLTKIFSETLFKINQRSRKLIFERISNGDSYKYNFGIVRGNSENSQFLDFVAEGTSSDESFVYEYIHRNGKGLIDIEYVYDWFLNELNVIFPQSKFRSLPLALKKDDKFAECLRLLLKYLNTGVDDVKLCGLNFEEVNIPDSEKRHIVSDLKRNPKMMISVDSNETIYLFEMNKGNILCNRIVTYHKNLKGVPVSFDLQEESDGTIRLLNILPMLIDMHFNDAVYLIDEIDRSMHPLLTKALLEIYFRIMSSKQTQLICTTHEAYLLDEKLRPDQFWFIRKNKHGASSVFPLGNKRLRAVLSKIYLSGDNDFVPQFEDQYLEEFLNQ